MEHLRSLENLNDKNLERHKDSQDVVMLRLTGKIILQFLRSPMETKSQEALFGTALRRSSG